MSNGELAPNPQPPLYQNLHESAELINYFDEAPGFNVDVPVPGAIYDLNRFRSRESEPGRVSIRLAWTGQGKLVTSDGRTVTSMDLDVPEDTAETSREPVQTYRFAYVLDAIKQHKANITVDNDLQQVSIVANRPNETPAHWLPMSDEDIVHMLNVFHDALQDGKRLNEETVQQIRNNNKLWENIRTKWPKGFPDDASSS